MGLSFWQIALVVLLFLLLFGRGKIPQLMGDIAQGIKSFREGMSRVGEEEETETKEPVARLEAPQAQPQQGMAVDSEVAERR